MADSIPPSQAGQKAIQLLIKKSEILLEEYNMHVIV